MNLTPWKILVVDDNPIFHGEFSKIFYAIEEPELANYVIESANNAATAIEMVRKASLIASPYAVIFIDVSLPTEDDGFEIAQKIWTMDSKVQIIVCTTVEYPWQEISAKLKISDNFIILKKTFSMNEIRQLVVALTKKWELQQQLQYQYENLNKELN